jgi:hypothetical protein
MVNNILVRRRSLTHTQQTLLTVETSDATNAAQADGNNTINVCQEILTNHPYYMSDQCTQDLAKYVSAKYHTITKKLNDALATRSSDSIVADATEALDKKTREYTSALSQLQAIINHEMLLAIGKLLPLAKQGGTVLPKLERAFAVHNADHRTKPRNGRKPYSATTAIALLVDEGTGVSTAMQGVARTNVLRHARPTDMPIYEWSISFEKPLRELKLTGYVMKDTDEDELYNNVFSAQLT